MFFANFQFVFADVFLPKYENEKKKKFINLCIYLNASAG